MRLVRYFPMVVVGAGFICQAVMPLDVCAWENPAIAVGDSSAAQSNDRIVDESVQQAGYYDSRFNPNAAMSAPAEVEQRNGPLFRGQAMHFPTLPFARQKPNTRPANQAAQSASKQVKPHYGVQPQQRAANRSAAVGRNVQPRVMGAAPQNAGSNNYQAMRNSANMPPTPIRQTPQPMPLAARQAPPATTNNSASSVSPRTTTPQAAAAPASYAVPASAAPEAQASPADLLVKQAHDWSTTAKTEQEYTRIIDTCRRAQSGQASPEVSKYAKNLTAWALNRRGQLKAEAAEDKQAILDFDEAIRADSNCWRAMHNRGVLLAQGGQFEKAFDDFSRTIQLNPQFAKAFSNRAALFMVANNLNAASQDYDRAVSLDANLAVAHRGYGRVCQLLGRLDDAAVHYDAAVQLAPSDAYAAACRADLLTDVGHYSEALDEYNRALTIDPKSRQAHCGLAWLLATCPDRSLRNPELAMQRAKSAIELDGQKDAVSYDSLAAAQASAGNFNAAIQSIHRAIELAPADERDIYRDRLKLYQHAKPYRIAPIERVAQNSSKASGNGEPGAGTRRL